MKNNTDGPIFSLRRDVGIFAGEKRKRWLYFLYLALLVHYELVDQQEEKELLSDIYVLF